MTNAEAAGIPVPAARAEAFGRSRGHGSSRSELPVLGPGKGAQTTRGLKRRSLILKVAADLFAQHGFDGVSINEIGFESGVTGPAIYRYFASKEELLVSIYEHLYRRASDGMTEILGREGLTAEETLSALIKLQIALAVEESEKIRIVEQEWRHLPARESEALRTLNREHFGVWRDFMREVRDDLPVPTVEMMLHAMLAAINSIALKRSGDAVGEAERAQLWAMAISLLKHQPVDAGAEAPSRRGRRKPA